MREKALILDENAIKRALIRISHEIIERNGGVENVALVGIRTRGYPLALRIADAIRTFEQREINTGILDITSFRDDLDLSTLPEKSETDIKFDLVGKDIVLVDDVLFTGRTARAGIEAVLRIGRPKSIQLAVLVDRGHRELPVRADYVGKNLPTSRLESVQVMLSEIDGKNQVILLEK